MLREQSTQIIKNDGMVSSPLLQSKICRGLLLSAFRDSVKMVTFSLSDLNKVVILLILL